MRHPVSIRLAVLAVLAAAGAGGHALAAECRPADAVLAGHYYLAGETEVGSELLLQADGRFRYALSYGAADALAHGCWRSDGKEIVLEAADVSHAPEMRMLKRLSVDGSGSMESLQPVPLTDQDEGAIGDTAMIELGGHLSAAPVWVEYADGRRQKELTDGQAQAHVQRAGMPAIKRIGVGLPGAAEPLRWFDNDEPGRRLFLVSVDAEALVHPAFKRMELRVLAPGHLQAALGQGVRGEYERK
jgi:hypothetical protein